MRGNLTRKFTNRRILTYTYNTRDQLTRIDSTSGVEGDYVLDYDTRGNVTRFGDLRLTYDASDQPVRITGGKLDVDYKHDGLMKRIMVINVPGRDKINHFALDGSLAGIDKSGRSDTDHIRANGELVATLERNGDFAEAKWTPSFRHNDHLGSTQVATGADGLVRFQEYYTPMARSSARAH